MPQGELWRFLANTDRFNREIGLPPVRYTFSPQAGGGSVVQAEARILGQRLVWREMPFEWVEPHWFRVRRLYQSGPFREVVGGVRLEARGEATLATCFAEVIPKLSGLGRVAASLLIGKKAVDEFVRACRNYEACYLGRLQNPHPREAALSSPADANRLSAAARALREAGADTALLERLLAHLRSAPDAQLIRFRPFELADAWGADRLDVLRLCLLATRAGALDLEWSILCPSCRGVKQSYGRLGDLLPRGHCDACNIEYGADFDRLVEVRFTVHPTLRPVTDRVYCIGGPMVTPHIHAQLCVPPGSSAEAWVALPPGRFRVRSLQVPRAAELAVLPRVAGERATLRINRETITADTCDLSAHRRLSLEFVNDADREVQVRLETEAWTDRGASAALVTSLQEFRDLFSSEVLSPGVELAIRNLTLMFSDLRGSTRLYDAAGDAPAYALVRDHFQFMAARIGRYRGAVVKTMGDAVLAVFLQPVDAIRAAAEIQQDIRSLRPSDPGLPPLVLKLGAHCGPCIAVNANDRLDYFGTTVNVAQRVQDQSEGGDLVVTDRMLADPEVARALGEAGARVERYEARLRGLEAGFVLYRVTFSAERPGDVAHGEERARPGEMTDRE
ncbi:MAG: adenylate/guanylate cyclase domain-containing protein [Armatimonadetes bacterium]|nr:adenylate/guanylate cyclase domain-containing protein [Armatimonadota bacterium]